MNELRFLFYNGMFAIAWVFVFQNLKSFFFDLVNHIKLNYPDYNYKLGVWSCTVTGISVAYIIWYIMTEPTQFIKLW